MELALYRGDALLGVFDSYQEVADLLDIKLESARVLGCPSNLKRYKDGSLKLYNYSKHDYHFYEQLEELT